MTLEANIEDGQVAEDREFGMPVALYDGHCIFCQRQVRHLQRLSRGVVEFRSFHERDALLHFPGLTKEDCHRELKFVADDGSVYGGVEAAVRIIEAGSPTIGRLALAYYLPGVRWFSDLTYRWIARNRYSILGRTDDVCDDACQVHS